MKGFLSVEGNQHRDPQLSAWRQQRSANLKWDIYIMPTLPGSRSIMGEGRKALRARGGGWLQQNAVFWIQQGRWKYESQQLWQHIQELYKLRADKTQAWSTEVGVKPHPELRGCWKQHMAPGRRRLFSSRVWLMVHQPLSRAGLIPKGVWAAHSDWAQLFI